MEQKISNFRNDIALFVVEEKDDDFIYRYVNRYYCQIINLEYPLQQEYSVSQVLDKNDLNEFKTYCKFLKKEYDYIKYEKNIYTNHLYTPHTVTMFSFIINGLYLIACSISYSELYLYEYQQKKNMSLLASQSDTLYSLFTLSLTDSDQCIISDINSVFCNYLGLEKEFDNNNIESIFPTKVANFLSQGFVTCLSNGRTTNKQLIYDCSEFDLQNFYCPQNGSYYLNVIFIPLNHDNKLSCICFVKDIFNDIDIKRSRNELILEYDTIFNASMNPIAILKVFDKNIIKLEKQNKRMEVLLNRFPELLSQLFQEHNNFDQLLIEKSRIESIITFNIRDNTYHFQINIVPIIEDMIVTKIVITILNVNSSKNKIVSPIHVRLTKREKEIVLLVAQGRKNDYIATKLGISTGTVKKTLSNVYKKYAITSRVELIKYFLNEQS
ncbi:response regulator transcription factor [Clostridium sp. Marseille-P299]|uniref:response regulator transcription factor n=1 Tax=Clostridium sp. Marseille-P299 TaxID=1805477 RepID=UPI000835248B|nr:helix-turn-helix transcriptional regulator [Clostridium sp. Marseille-P299]